MKRILICISLLTIFGCSSNEEFLTTSERLQKDIEDIEQYLSDQGLTAQSTSSGLHYIIEEPGSGGHPGPQSEVEVRYRGYFLDGETFDQTSGNNTITFPLSGVIQGWQEGIPLFQKNGNGQLFIPSGLGYGSKPPSGIPADAVLIFDVELVNFQ